MSGREPGHLLGTVLRAVFGRAFPALWRTRVIGRENVPRGAAIVASNHASNLDPLLVNMTCPRYVRFMAKQEMWSTALGRWLYPRLGAFPVRRRAADRTAIATATRILEEGGVLGVFPEGTRGSGGLGEGQSGAAFLALRTGSPVVPTAVHGTAGALPEGARFPRFPRVTIRFGTPIDPGSFAEGGRRERVDAMTDAIMRAISLELEEARAA